jgi:acetylornithine deacetylase/succinyl-diaminopimelate desuccinylase-like protein
MRFSSCLAAACVLATAASAADTGEADFRVLYKELVETNTTLSAGSCTLAAEKMASRLKAVGYTDTDLHPFAVPEHPKEGGLVAALPGSDQNAKAILLLAHLDVVEAKREDWKRDPFTLFEEGGYFYGRGTSDDKSMVAIFTDLMIRFKREGYQPRHTVKLALTCGEETSGAFNGAKWLAAEHKDWIDAAIALNEGGGGELDESGKRVAFDIEAAEKVYQDYTLTVTNPGGHSSRPRPDNAIYEMAAALKKIAAYEFPAMLNDATRGYFTEMAKIKGGAVAGAMAAIVKNPNDRKADAALSKDPFWHSILRTTCVATLIDGGHAPNALPQKVVVNVNCRIFPGIGPDAVRAALVKAIGDPRVDVAVKAPRSPATPAPKLGPDVLEPVKAAAAEVYPGVPVVPVMAAWATDGIYTSAAGIPTYGIQGFFVDPDQGGIHGLNERIRVQSLMDGREFHYRLVKRLAGS